MFIISYCGPVNNCSSWKQKSVTCSNTENSHHKGNVKTAVKWSEHLLFLFLDLLNLCFPITSLPDQILLTLLLITGHNFNGEYHLWSVLSNSWVHLQIDIPYALNLLMWKNNNLKLFVLCRSELEKLKAENVKLQEDLSVYELHKEQMHIQVRTLCDSFNAFYNLKLGRRGG